MLVIVLIVLGILLVIAYFAWFFASEKYFSKIRVLFADTALILLCMGTVTVGFFLRDGYQDRDIQGEAMEEGENQPVGAEPAAVGTPERDDTQGIEGGQREADAEAGQPEDTLPETSELSELEDGNES